MVFLPSHLLTTHRYKHFGPSKIHRSVTKDTTHSLPSWLFLDTIQSLVFIASSRLTMDWQTYANLKEFDATRPNLWLKTFSLVQKMRMFSIRDWELDPIATESSLKFLKFEFSEFQKGFLTVPWNFVCLHVVPAWIFRNEVSWSCNKTSKINMLRICFKYHRWKVSYIFLFQYWRFLIV